MKAEPGSMEMLSDVVDLRRYPITAPEAAACRTAIADARVALAETGCAQLPAFLTPEAVAAMCREVEDRLHLADTTSAYQNAYLCDDRPDLPDDHPIRQFQERRNKFLCRDRIDRKSPMIRLFEADAFTRFIRDATEQPALFPYADPISGVLVNIQDGGDIFPWHFDTNEVSISFALRNADAGGVFEYAPRLRSDDDPNYDGVKAVLDGDRRQVVAQRTKPGDLQIFLGRCSLHRVTQVESSDARYSLIFGYSGTPGLCASEELARATFGRAYPEHAKAALRI